MPTFLADENIAPLVVRKLRFEGFEVLDVKEQGWQGKSDQFLTELAIKNDSVIITRDQDFMTLLWPAAKHPGIVILNYREQRSTRVIEHLALQLKSSLIRSLKGRVTIITEDAIEQL